VTRPPLSRLVSPAALTKSEAWLEARGPQVVIASRFLPGTRVATSVAAGVLGLGTWRFLWAATLGALLWTPVVVGGAWLAAAWSAPAAARTGSAGAIVFGAGVLAALRVARGFASHDGRRRLLSLWRRVTRWEFWPPWIFYVPVLAWILLLALRYRSLTVFTAANPGMPAGGFVGESKSDILSALQRGGAPVAPFVVLTAGTAPEERVGQARTFADRQGWPVVLKPDTGQRGTGVRVVRSPDALDLAARTLSRDAILQAYVPGVEFGLFYARRPSDRTGRVVSLTEKRLPHVVGDGRRTLEQLILDDDRTVTLWRVYAAANRAALDGIVPEGGRVQLCELGSHCRGAVFLDGAAASTPALAAAVERASRAMPGFSFGRFDVRSASVDDLKTGRFTILELNGVTSEPTHIYHPGTSLLAAYRALGTSWSLAFAIGAEHAASGARVWEASELASLAIGYRRVARLSSNPVTSQP
jgi:hypothetical protein